MEKTIIQVRKDRLFQLLKKPWRVETKTNRENKKPWKSHLLTVPCRGWNLTQSGKYISVFFRSSYLEMDKYSSLIFQVMEKAASNFNPCLKKTDNFIWEQILIALKNSTVIVYEISCRITSIPFKLCKLLNKCKLGLKDSWLYCNQMAFTNLTGAYTNKIY